MATRTTAVYPYKNLVVSAAGGETDLVAATGFLAANDLPAASTLLGAKNLLTLYGVGKHTYFNAVILRCYATCNDGDQASMTLYGISRMPATETRVPERIAAITWTFSTCLRVAGVRWADIATVTDYHIGDIRTADAAASNTPARVELDVLGYEWLYAIVHTRDTGTPTGITVQMRPY